MLRLIIFKELHDILISAKFAIAFGVCSFLIIFVFITGALEYKVAQEEYESAVSANLRQYEKLENWEYLRTYEAVLPPQALATLIGGTANDIGRKVYVPARGETQAYETEDSRYNEHPLFAVFRFLDLEFVFGTALSLMAILFAFDAVNGEKENGTLKLTFANAVPRATYIVGKLIGAFTALTIPLLIPILLGVLLASVLGVVLSANEWIRLGLFFVTGFLYLGVFLTLSVLVSTLTQQSSSAFLVLLVIWVVVTLVFPRAAVLSAGSMVSVPGRADIETQLMQWSRQTNAELNIFLREYQTENRPNFTPEMSVEERNKINQEFMEKLQNAFQEKTSGTQTERDALMSRLYEERNNKLEVQQSRALSVARLSPAAVFSFAATTLAGSSLELKRDFLMQVNAFQAVYSNFAKSKSDTNSAVNYIIFRNADDPEKEKMTIDIQELPVFKYKQAEVTTIVQAALPDILLLILFNLLFFMGSFVAFLRYDLR